MHASFRGRRLYMKNYDNTFFEELSILAGNKKKLKILSFHQLIFIWSKKNVSMNQNVFWRTNNNICSNQPMTGFFRNGCCDTDESDHGLHTVCVMQLLK